jgi:hypothetical protein
MTALAELRQDFAYSVRMLAKSPGYSAVAVLSLALGIGANTAIFSLIDSVILKMLPVTNPQELVALTDPTDSGSISEPAAGNGASFPPASSRVCAIGRRPFPAYSRRRVKCAA